MEGDLSKKLLRKGPGYVIISSLLFYDDVTVCSIFVTMVKARPFC